MRYRHAALLRRLMRSHFRGRSIQQTWCGHVPHHVSTSLRCVDNPIGYASTPTWRSPQVELRSNYGLFINGAEVLAQDTATFEVSSRLSRSFIVHQHQSMDRAACASHCPAWPHSTLRRTWPHLPAVPGTQPCLIHTSSRSSPTLAQDSDLHNCLGLDCISTEPCHGICNNSL